MLPAGSRLTRREEFASVISRGRRSGRGRLVVHLQVMNSSLEFATGNTPSVPRVGFVVSRAVGGSVVRHRVVRRLRHLVAERLDALPSDACLVIRALRPAADATSAQLADDLDAGLRGALRKRQGGSP
ncbi:MAG: ribonuclease P protein component [Pseudonocardia sp.]